VPCGSDWYFLLIPSRWIVKALEVVCICYNGLILLKVSGVYGRAYGTRAGTTPPGRPLNGRSMRRSGQPSKSLSGCREWLLGLCRSKWPHTHFHTRRETPHQLSYHQTHSVTACPIRTLDSGTQTGLAMAKRISEKEVASPTLSRCGSRKNYIPSLDCLTELTRCSQEGRRWHPSVLNAWTI
jgi:hypothetical protein